MGYVSLCGWREARGEGDEGVRGVIHVIGNRVNAWYATQVEPWHYAIYLHGQFTSMSDPNDPNYSLFPADNDPVWIMCQRMAQAIVSGQDSDNTGGALYYANLDNITPGGWFSKYILGHPETHPPTVVIAHTTFFA